MLYLILSAATSLLLVVLFKLFGRYQIEAFQAIAINYLVCISIGIAMQPQNPFQTDIISQPWFPILAFLGFLFISSFSVIKIAVQRFGVAITSVAQRMSLVISVIFAILFFNEAYNASKIIGIIIALASVVLINIPSTTPSDNNPNKPLSKLDYFLPLFIFAASGLIEIILQYVQKVHQLEAGMQSTVLFGAAAFWGNIALAIAVLTGKIKLNIKSLFSGVLLGIPNYFSIYFLLEALQTLDASLVYPVSNILIVGAATIIGYFGFKEKLSTINILGVGLALLSIFLITF